MEYVSMTEKQIEDDAYTLQNYISLGSLTDELEELEINYTDQPKDARYDDLVKVFNRAISLSIPY